MQENTKNDLHIHTKAQFSKVINDEEDMRERLLTEFSALVHDSSTIRSLIALKLENLGRGNERQDLSSKDVILVRGDRFAISIRVASSSEQGPLGTSQDLMFVATLNDQPLQWRTFSPSSPFDLNVFTPDIQLVESELQSLPPQQIAVFDKPSTLFEIVVNSQTHLIRLVVTPPYEKRSTQDWTFSRSSLKPLGTSASHFRDTSLTLAAAVVGEMGDDSSVAALHVTAENNAAHFVRWAAIKAIAVIDADQAIEAAMRAITDDHPHVREAAAIVLQQLKAN